MTPCAAPRNLASATSCSSSHPNRRKDSRARGDSEKGLRIRPEHIYQAFREFREFHRITEHPFSKKFPLIIPETNDSPAYSNQKMTGKFLSENFTPEDCIAPNYGTPFSFKSRNDQISPASAPRAPRGFLAPFFRFGPNRSRLA